MNSAPGRRWRTRDTAISFAIEPGRFLVGDAGVIEAEVIGVVERPGQACSRWVFIDVGLFQGLSEASGESIRYPLSTAVGGPTSPAVVAGPTCDSTDILYERRPVELPLALPVILEGIRLSVVINLGTATIGSTVAA